MTGCVETSTCLAIAIASGCLGILVGVFVICLAMIAAKPMPTPPHTDETEAP